MKFQEALACESPEKADLQIAEQRLGDSSDETLMLTESKASG